MSLDKLLEALKESSHSCDDIGSVSKKIENQKFKLATSIKDRQMYLEVVNLAIVMQSNIYSMAGLIWDEDEPLDEIVEELKKACNRMIEDNAKIFEDAFKKIKKDRKKEKREKDNDE